MRGGGGERCVVIVGDRCYGVVVEAIGCGVMLGLRCGGQMWRNSRVQVW